MGAFLRKYGTGTGADVWLPLIKRAAVDFAVGADFTPVAGDVKVSLDGAAAANIGTLPVALAMGNTAVWKFVFSNAELQCKVLTVTVADAATKAVEDQAFVIETYGNASAMYQADLSAANLPANVTQLLGTAWLTPAVAGTPDVNAKQLGGTAQTGRDVGASVLLSSGTGTGQVKLSAGYVAPNWGDVGNPTTVVGLSGTTVKTATDVEADTQDIQARLPAALTANGNIKADTLRVSGALQSAGDIFGAVDGVEGDTATILGRLTAARAGYLDNLNTGVPLSAAAVDAVWDEAQSGHVTAGTFGLYLDAAVSSRSTFAGGAVASVTGNVGGNVVGSVASVTAAVTVGTNNDKTGYALTAGERTSIAAAVWAFVAEGAHTVADLLRGIAAFAMGKSSGGGTTTIVFRDLGDTKDRLVATVNTSGNRTAVTRDLT